MVPPPRYQGPLPLPWSRGMAPWGCQVQRGHATSEQGPQVPLLPRGSLRIPYHQRMQAPPLVAAQDALRASATIFLPILATIISHASDGAPDRSPELGPALATLTTSPSPPTGPPPRAEMPFSASPWPCHGPPQPLTTPVLCTSGPWVRYWTTPLYAAASDMALQTLG